MDASKLPEAEQRAAVVVEARTWLQTPYVHRAGVKGAGADCGQIIGRIFEALGLIADFETGEYAHDFHLHRDDETYLKWLTTYTARILKDHPQPGDIVAVRNGRTFSHAGIITDWPMIVHASAPAMMVLEEDVTNSPVSLMRNGEPRPMRFYSYWAKAK